jgi:PAS domain S-box-containing protein
MIEGPSPIDKEIMLDDKKVLLSITDTKGVIEYCNEDFVEVCGYEEYELAGAPHNIVRHPDMPKVVFKLMWDRLDKEENIIAIVKNMSKTGRYYWVMTDFVIRKDDEGNVSGYKAFRKPAPRKAIEAVIPFYKKLREIEEARGMEAAEKFFHGFLDGENTNYDDFIQNLIIDNIKPEFISKEVSKPVTKASKASFFRRIFDIN